MRSSGSVLKLSDPVSPIGPKMGNLLNVYFLRNRACIPEPYRDGADPRDSRFSRTLSHGESLISQEPKSISPMVEELAH